MGERPSHQAPEPQARVPAASSRCGGRCSGAGGGPRGRGGPGSRCGPGGGPSSAAPAPGGALAPAQPRRSALVVEASWWHQERGDVLCFERLAVRLQPLAVNLEGQHLRALKEFVDSSALGSAASSAGSGPAGAADGSR